MVWNWIFKRLFTEERVGYLIKKNEVVISEVMKNSIIDILEDEEIALGIVQYTDQIYNRYMGKSGKLWGTLSGAQKGLNAMDITPGSGNPLVGILKGEETFSISGIFKQIALGFLTKQQPGTSPGPGIPSGSSRVTPNMRPL